MNTVTHFIAYDYATLNAFATSEVLDDVIEAAQLYVTSCIAPQGVIIVDSNFTPMCRVDVAV
jgi:hypothetical protein